MRSVANTSGPDASVEDDVRWGGHAVSRSLAAGPYTLQGQTSGWSRTRRRGWQIGSHGVKAWFVWCVSSSLLAVAVPVRADELSVAVAANFLSTVRKLAPLFEQARGHRIVPSPGSSGQLYAQIKRGAPYDVLLSADAARPARLEAEGLGVKGSRVTYAVGRLVLWSPKPGVVDSAGKVLERAGLHFVALADPKTAPYGAAAEQVLSSGGLLKPLRAANKLVYGESVGQAHQFVSSGHADCGFVALSQVLDAHGKPTGSLWFIPGQRYARLNQDAIVLRRSAKRSLAQEFLTWLRTDRVALKTIRASGYGLPER